MNMHSVLQSIGWAIVAFLAVHVVFGMHHQGKPIIETQGEYTTLIYASVIAIATFLLTLP